MRVSFEHVAPAFYVAQWQKAVVTAVCQRRISCLIVNLDINEEGVGAVWVWWLIPSEDVNGAGAELREPGIFLTQQFLPVTTDVRAFLRSRSDTELPDSEQDYYFLNIENVQRFYGYGDARISGISNWYYPNLAFKSFLNAGNNA